MQRCDYLTDGYTEKGFIAEVVGLHGDLRFEYRPLLVSQEAALYELAQASNQAEFQEAVGKLLVRQLVSWSLKDNKGTPIQITEANVMRLRPRLFNRLFSIVRGTEPTELDPVWKTETRQDAVKAKMEAILAGTTVGEVKEAADQKN